MGDDIDRAVALLRAGDLVAFPTETVYGLGADAGNAVAVAKVFAAKGRPADHPLIVHIAGAGQLEAWARDVPEAAYRLAAAFWPGPLTLILKRSAQVLDAVSGGQDTVGLRVPGHPLALELLRRFNADAPSPRGIAAPSANRFGRISPTSADHVRAEFGDAVPLVLDGGACRIGIESTIVDLSRGGVAVLRPGAISAAAIAAVLGDVAAVAAVAPRGATPAPRVSGSLASHYAPRTPLRLVAGEQLAEAVSELLADDRRLAVLARRPSPLTDARLRWRRLPSDAAGFAHELYAELRLADASGADTLLVEAPPDAAEWTAVIDRLRRAAAADPEKNAT